MAYARLKELESFHNNASCCFCKQNSNDELLYGKIYQYGDIITHYFCLLFSSLMEQNGKDEEGILGFLIPDIKKELARGLKLSCVYCHHNGATINCSIKTCKKQYHFTCAADNGALHHYFGQFKSFCQHHRSIQAVPSTACLLSKKTLCIMCHEEVKSTPSLNTIWASCCKTAWFHRLCVQKMAVSAGYFFKCPNCNNKEKFRNEMLQCGIYIPDQDASWELEPNAFRELNERYSKCDANNCKCPRGRTYTCVEGLWEISLCSFCGSQGIHQHCGVDEIDDKNVWTCSLCSSVVNKSTATKSSSSMSTSTNTNTNTSTNIPGPSANRRGRRRGRASGRKRNRSPNEVEESPAAKAVPEVTSQNPIGHIEERMESINTTCLYSNEGAQIQVVAVNNIQENDDELVEIGGVNINQNIIELISSDEEDERTITTVASSTSSIHLIRSVNSNRKPLIASARLVPPTAPTITSSTECARGPSSTTQISSIIIDSSDSEEEIQQSSVSSSGCAVNLDNDEDDDVVFVGCHTATESFSGRNSSALIRITENNNMYEISPTEMKKRSTNIGTNSLVNTNAVSSTNSASSNVIWQSVPRHKSIVHSFHQSQIVSSKNLNSNFKRDEVNKTAPTQSSSSKIMSESTTSVTNGCVAGSKNTTKPQTVCLEMIELD